MDILTIYKTRKEEIIEKTLNLMPRSFDGTETDRTFYFYFDENNDLQIEYLYSAGMSDLEPNCFYTVKSYRTPNPNEFGYQSLYDMDFKECGYGIEIEDAIDLQIRRLETII